MRLLVLLLLSAPLAALACADNAGAARERQAKDKVAAAPKKAAPKAASEKAKSDKPFGLKSLADTEPLPVVSATCR